MFKEVVKNVLLAPVILVVIVLVTPLLLAAGVWNYVNGIYLNYAFRKKWKNTNKRILFVYSESPSWQKYIEENIIPKIENEAVLLNWSKRSEWKNNKPLEARVLGHWGGGTEFNPMAVVFEPSRKVEIIRFYKAFKDHKHGKDSLLKEKEKDLYAHINVYK